MTDEMVEKVATLSETSFGKALEYVEAAEGFVLEQAPLLVQEILAYGLFTSLFWTVFWGLVCGGIAWSVVKLYKFFIKEHDEDMLFLPFLLGIIGGGGSMVGFCYNLFEAAKIVFAPRLYLLEQLKSLL